MNILYMAVKNLKKNFSFYMLYLVSVSLVITIFFAFTSFSQNEVMLKKISSDGRVGSMCRLISVCLMVFVLFYMTYSNSFFLRRRTKELGIYALLGYRSFTVLSLLTAENIIICTGAFFIGLLLGALMHKSIVYGITALLNLQLDYAGIPFLNRTAVFRTGEFIVFVICIITISNAGVLSRSSLMDLVRFEKRADKKMKFHKLSAWFGLLLILFGYGVALDILRGTESFWISCGFYAMGILTFLSVVFGSALFIFAFLPYAVEKGKQNKRAFYTEIKIITAPNFIYRIRSNAGTLIMLTLLSAATLAIASVMSLSLFFPLAALSRMAPSELECRVENEEQADEIKALVGDYVSAGEVSCIRTDIYKITSDAANLPMEYNIGISKGDSDNEKIVRQPGFECISYSQYTTLLQAQGKEKEAGKPEKLQDNECILVKYQPNADKSSERGAVYPLAIGNESVMLIVKDTTLLNPFSFSNSIGTLIVSDNIYEKVKASAAPIAKVLSINGSAWTNEEELYGKVSALLDNSPYLQGHTHRLNVIVSLNSSTFLLIGFLVVLFFIATGSILYFNNVSAVIDSKSDYEILSKMGYSDKMLHKMIRKQVFLFFFIPFLFGLLDAIFATIVYKTALMQNLLGNSLVLYVPVIIAVGLTAFIYVIYYLLTVRSCYVSL